MTINDMIRRLKEYREELGGDTEVRLMTQEQWPFEHELYGLASSAEIDYAVESDEENPDEETEESDEEETESILYLVEGTQLGYGSKAAWDVAV